MVYSCRSARLPAATASVVSKEQGTHNLQYKLTEMEIAHVDETSTCAISGLPLSGLPLSSPLFLATSTYFY
jgi:hypothetical protein